MTSHAQLILIRKDVINHSSGNSFLAIHVVISQQKPNVTKLNLHSQSLLTGTNKTVLVYTWEKSLHSRREVIISSAKSGKTIREF